MSFPCQSLEAGKIRVLKIQPASDPDAPISIDLHHISPTSSKYTAISYVWGDPTHIRHVSISGCAFGVGENLFRVLRSLRGMPDSPYLWIDAICINQTDIPERNSQVKYMAEIYRNAVEVVGWLGDKTPDFDAGFKLLEALIDEKKENYLESKDHEEAWEALI